MKIHLSRPDISEKEIEAVVRVLKTPNLCLGPMQDAFQETFSRYVGTKYAEAVSSGTAGLHLALLSCGIGKADEVITTPFSFIASANSILFVGAKPVFVDIDPINFNIDVKKIESKITRRTKAILVVHALGLPSDMKAIQRIARRHNLFVIEDACEALGAKIEGRQVGTFSDIAVFGLYPNKQITTGEGGMITTSSKKLADFCKSTKNQGRNVYNKFIRLGYNYRLSDINCALGLAQMKRINIILSRREAISEVYNHLLVSMKDIELPCRIPGYNRSWFTYVIKLKDKFNRYAKHNIIKAMGGYGIECGNYFPAIHLTPFYRKAFGYKENSFPQAEKVSARTLALPFYNNLAAKKIDYVARSLEKALQNAL